jgi:hypothetical protein
MKNEECPLPEGLCACRITRVLRLTAYLAGVLNCARKEITLRPVAKVKKAPRPAVAEVKPRAQAIKQVVKTMLEHNLES